MGEQKINRSLEQSPSRSNQRVGAADGAGLPGGDGSGPRRPRGPSGKIEIPVIEVSARYVEGSSGVIAYQTAPWHDLFTGVIGAAAALAGLIFVAVSLNAEDILNHPRLPSLAARSLALLLSLMVMSAFVLAPGQPRIATGIEISALGVGLAAGVLITSIRGFDDKTLTVWKVRDITMSVFATFPMAVAGLSLTAGAGGGLYWALAATICGFTAAVLYAWVLLIEIKR